MAASTEQQPPPSMAAACQAAEELADNLRTVYPEYRVRTVQNIMSRFEVVVEVPFHSWEGRRT